MAIMPVKKNMSWSRYCIVTLIVAFCLYDCAASSKGADSGAVCGEDGAGTCASQSQEEEALKDEEAGELLRVSLLQLSQRSAKPTPSEEGGTTETPQQLFGADASACADRGCGGAFKGWMPCQCTASCEKHGNCCEDYGVVCSSTCAKSGCGVGFVHGRACQCSETCADYQNCCDDYAHVCEGASAENTPDAPTENATDSPTEPSADAPAAGAEEATPTAAPTPAVHHTKQHCAVLGCGGAYRPDRSCQCSAGCEKHGNCCDDFETACSRSCAASGCGLEYVHGRLCQCGKGCTKYGNCCSDYKHVCAAGGTGGTGGTGVHGAAGANISDSCATRGCAETYNPNAACQCGDTCLQYGNCCHDYGQTCLVDGDTAVLGMLQFNPHGECFENHWAARRCTENFQKLADEMLHKRDPPVEFVTIAYTSNKYNATRGWKKEHHTCEGWHTDDAMLLHDSKLWDPLEFGAVGCMEKHGRPYIIRAFRSKKRKPQMTVVVVSAHFPHTGGYYKRNGGAALLKKEITKVKKDAGTDKVVLMADTNRGRTRKQGIAGVFPSYRIMNDIGAASADGDRVRTTTPEFTCCNKGYVYAGYDRVVANFGIDMVTVLPLHGHSPSWALRNFHMPLIGYLKYSPSTLAVEEPGEPEVPEEPEEPEPEEPEESEESEEAEPEEPEEPEVPEEPEPVSNETENVPDSVAQESVSSETAVD